MTNQKHFYEHANYLLNLTQAAHLLDYSDYRIIKELIEHDKLPAYRIGNSKRVKVLYHDLMKVPQLISTNQEFQN